MEKGEPHEVWRTAQKNQRRMPYEFPHPLFGEFSLLASHAVEFAQPHTRRDRNQVKSWLIRRLVASSGDADLMSKAIAIQGWDAAHGNVGRMSEQGMVWAPLLGATGRVRTTVPQLIVEGLTVQLATSMANGACQPCDTAHFPCTYARCST